MNVDYGLAFAIGSFLVAHLGTALWFASHIQTTVKQLARTVDELRADIRSLFVQKADVAVLQSETRGLGARVETLEKVLEFWARPSPVTQHG